MKRTVGSYLLVSVVALFLVSIGVLQQFLVEASLLADTEERTGFQIGDSPFFLTAMNIFNNDFFSPYVTGDLDPHDWRRFALPHHWLYGALGWLATRWNVSHLSALMFANAVCGFVYLLAVWRFLSHWRPRYAGLAFGIFALGGGLGGWIYMAAVSFGMDTQAGFETWFHRYARYELIEGPFIAPWLVIPRLYYTLPLALGFVVLTMLVKELERYKSAEEVDGEDGDGTRVSRRGAARHEQAHALQKVRMPWRMVASAGVLFVVTMLNARLGPLFFFAAACLLYAEIGIPRGPRMRYSAILAVPVVIGVGLVSFLFSFNPSGVENVAQLLRRAAWFGSVVSALFWLWPLLIWSVIAHARRLPLLGRIAVFAASGYLIAFAIGYAIHQVYWGNLFAGGDTAATIAVSDWALLGVIPGILAAIYIRPLECMGLPMPRGAAPRDAPTLPEANTGNAGAPENTAALLWALGLLAVSISAFGDGTFMRLMPERCLVLLGVPLAVIAAERLHHIARHRIHFVIVYVPLIIGSGLVSILAGALHFQLPSYGSDYLDRDPFHWTRNQLVARNADWVLQSIDNGVVLAPADFPPFFGDVLVHRDKLRDGFFVRLPPGHPNLREQATESAEKVRTVFGQPSLEFSGRNMLELAMTVQHFYAADTTETERLAFVREHQVDWIFVYDREIAEYCREYKWLEVETGELGWTVYRVRKDAL